MQHDQGNSEMPATRPRLARARTRFVGMDPQQDNTGPLSTTGKLGTEQTPSSVEAPKKAAPSALYDHEQPSRAEQWSAHLMQLSGMLRPLRTTKALQIEIDEEDGYWPLGIQQIGPLPIVNLYGSTPFGRTLPGAVPLVTATDNEPARPLWQRILSSPACKISLGLLAGLALLFLIALFVNVPTTLALLQTHLGTPQGIGLVLLAGLLYLAGNSIRGVRWKLFLNSVNPISTLKAIELYHIASLLNFLLPIHAGEAAKSLELKRIANIPISKSLPTVAMDKALDLLPVLIIIVLAPLLGVPMSLQVWLVLGLASLLLLALLTFLGLTLWKRAFALTLLRNLLGWLPSRVSSRIEGFITGFVDALLVGASRPRIFLPALFLTVLALLCESLFVMLVFQALGTSIPFGLVLLGATLCSIFAILPVPPGQVGSSQAVSLLIFSGLLSLSGNLVFAASILAYPLTALLMAAAGLASLAPNIKQRVAGV